MKTLEELSVEISDTYANAMNNKGPMQVFMKECATGYIHSFHIRGLLAHYQNTGNEKWLRAAKLWADFSIKMQGTYGDSAAFNMGYLYEETNAIPHSWFVADTTDQAVALLNVAYILAPSDQLFIKILESVLKFDEYIQQWNLGENGFALGYMDGENLKKEPYHCAVARCISYYSGMFLVFGKKIYRQRGLTLVEHMLKHDDFNSNHHEAPSTNRCYASYALLDAYYILAENDDDFKKAILEKASKSIIPWAIENQTNEGFWAHDRFGNQPGAVRAVDKSEFGVYSWGVLYGLEIFSKLLPANDDLQSTIDKSYTYMMENLNTEDENRWGHHSWATTAIAAKFYPQYFFPMGAGNI
jgi:hypothetical protein